MTMNAKHKADKRRSRSGAVIVEFALAFPMLLITFIFVCQVLNVFTYDVLGSYAAFASARSYAVNRNAGWEEDGFDVEQQRKNAAQQAYGVAVAIMATYSLPQRGEAKPDGWNPATELEIGDYLAAATDYGVRAPDSSYYAAHHRLSVATDYRPANHDFQVSEYSEDGIRVIRIRDGRPSVGIAADADSTFSISMKAGYGYPDSEPVEVDTGSAGFWGEFLVTLQKMFNLPVREPSGHAMKVGRVHFVYRYPTILTQISGSYLAPGFVRQEQFTIPIYQSCAVPIEPVPRVLLDAVRETTTNPPKEVDEDRLYRLEAGINHALDELYVCIRSIEDTLTNERFGRSRNVSTWEDGRQDLGWSEARHAIVEMPELARIHPNSHSALKESAIDHLLKEYKDVEPSEGIPPVYNANIWNAISREWAGTGSGNWLFDPKAGLDADTVYRKTVQGWIVREIRPLTSEINRLTTRITNRKDDIKSNEDLIDDEGDKEEPDQDDIEKWKQEIKDWEEANLKDEQKREPLIADRIIWENRDKAEDKLIKGNEALKKVCLAKQLITVQKALSAYYDFLEEEFEKQKKYLTDLQSAASGGGR